MRELPCLSWKNLVTSCATLFGVLKESYGRGQVLLKMPDFGGG